MSTDYKTAYSSEKNINTLEKGSFNDFGDGSPGKQVIAKQAPSEVFDVNLSPKGVVKNIYNEVAAVVVGGEILLNSYTVLPGMEAQFMGVDLSGDNIGRFLVKKNGAILKPARTWWTSFNYYLTFDKMKLVASDLIEVYVINRGTTVAPFECTIGVDEYAI